MEVFRSAKEVEMLEEVDAMGGSRGSCRLPHHSREVAHVHAIASASDTLSMGRRPPPAFAADQTSSGRTGSLEHWHRPGEVRYVDRRRCGPGHLVGLALAQSAQAAPRMVSRGGCEEGGGGSRPRPEAARLASRGLCVRLGTLGPRDLALAKRGPDLGRDNDPRSLHGSDDRSGLSPLGHPLALDGAAGPYARGVATPLGADARRT